MGFFSKFVFNLVNNKCMSPGGEEQKKSKACLADMSVVLMFFVTSSVLLSSKSSLHQATFVKRCNITPE